MTPWLIAAALYAAGGILTGAWFLRTLGHNQELQSRVDEIAYALHSRRFAVAVAFVSTAVWWPVVAVTVARRGAPRSEDS